ncbi:MAG: metallophosphoesterase [Myxococcales bacterium]|nr:metallophosphoesterase [Myxococcales bacterium]
MTTFSLASAAAVLAVVAVAARLRGRFYAIYSGVLLGLMSLIGSAMYGRFEELGLLREYLHAITFVNFLMLVVPSMRPLPYRLLVSIPAAFYLAATLLAFPWALLGAFGLEVPLPWLPYAAAAIGVAESLWTRETEVDVMLDGEHVEGLKRKPVGATQKAARPLRIVQITDPHLGPFMSVARLRRICERAVAREPDLIVLTGDLLTMESRRTPETLDQALMPLAAARGKVFACMGNHDHEAPELVRSVLAKHGITLLVDQAQLVDTPAGHVQVLGIDHHFRDRHARLKAVCAAHPKPEGVLRIVLLHDPGAFRRLDEGHGDLVLSGHTHGGQVGLLTLGLPWTFLSMVSSMPDHGLWARGRDRLYVHRGTGHYGFPLRVFVPAEQSLLQVHRPETEAGGRTPGGQVSAS